MVSLCRRLQLPASDNCHDCDRDTNATPVFARQCGRQAPKSEWLDISKYLLDLCEAILKTGCKQTCPALIALIAAQVTLCSEDSFRAGFDAGLRQSAKLRAENARNGKRARANQRGRILRQAIIAVCEQQKLVPTASVKFAESIKPEVIATARQIGLPDSRSGTSSRSIQRHIAALLKDMRML